MLLVTGVLQLSRICNQVPCEQPVLRGKWPRWIWELPTCLP